MNGDIDALKRNFTRFYQLKICETENSCLKKKCQPDIVVSFLTSCAIVFL